MHIFSRLIVVAAAVSLCGKALSVPINRFVPVAPGTVKDIIITAEHSYRNTLEREAPFGAGEQLPRRKHQCICDRLGFTGSSRHAHAAGKLLLSVGNTWTADPTTDQCERRHSFGAQGEHNPDHYS
jgi:hypothetical protein